MMNQGNALIVRPKFNVTPPFDGVINLQLNREMSDLLANLLEEVRDEEQTLEPELVALAAALRDPYTAVVNRINKRQQNRSRYGDNRQYQDRGRGYHNDHRDQEDRDPGFQDEGERDQR